MENQYSDLPQRFYDSIEFVEQLQKARIGLIPPFRASVWSKSRQAFHVMNLMELTIQVG